MLIQGSTRVYFRAIISDLIWLNLFGYSCWKKYMDLKTRIKVIEALDQLWVPTLNYKQIEPDITTTLLWFMERHFYYTSVINVKMWYTEIWFIYVCFGLNSSPGNKMSSDIAKWGPVKQVSGEKTWGYCARGILMFHELFAVFITCMRLVLEMNSLN